MPTDQERQWMAAWRRAGPKLQELRDAELRRLDDAEGTRLATFLGLAHPVANRTGSGLLEFQKFMKKWRDQKEL